MNRCDYHGLLRGIDYYTTGEWTWAPAEQCPGLATRYVTVHQGEVTHLSHVCAEHEAKLRDLPGFVSSEPLVGVS